jgi:hypothetical protein
MSTEEKAAQTKLGIREWIFITGSIVTMLAGIGGHIGNNLFTQTDSETQELKRKVEALEEEKQKIWLELSRQGWRVTALENAQGYDASGEQVQRTRKR